VDLKRRYRLNEINFDVDIASCGFGIRTSLMCAIEDLARELSIEARKADVEARLERVSIASGAKVHFGIDCGIGRELHFEPRQS
jgi:hypothetical protein